MTDCDDLIAGLQRLVQEQVDLAMIAETPPVAAMHLDLALFGGEQVNEAEHLCDEA